MADAGCDHSHIMVVAELHAVVVAYGASGMDYGYNACFVGDFNAVGKREECIGGHHAAGEIEAKRMSLLYGLTEGIDARCLTYS